MAEVTPTTVESLSPAKTNPPLQHKSTRHTSCPNIPNPTLHRRWTSCIYVKSRVQNGEKRHGGSRTPRIPPRLTHHLRRDHEEVKVLPGGAVGRLTKWNFLGDFELPYYTKFLLIAAFLASYNPPRYDVRYFSRNAEERRKKRGGGAAKSKEMKNLGGKVGQLSVVEGLHIYMKTWFS